MSECLVLSDQMVANIRRDILLGIYMPGDKLRTNDLKLRYEVGGTPIREALMQLVWQNFVVMLMSIQIIWQASQFITKCINLRQEAATQFIAWQCAQLTFHQPVR